MRTSDQPEPRYCVNLYAFPKSRHSVCSVIRSSKISELIILFLYSLYIDQPSSSYSVPTVEGNYVFVKTQGLPLYTCCEHVYVQVVMYSMLQVYYLISPLHHFCTVAKQTPQTPAFTLSKFVDFRPLDPYFILAVTKGKSNIL